MPAPRDRRTREPAQGSVFELAVEEPRSQQVHKMLMPPMMTRLYLAETNWHRDNKLWVEMGIHYLNNRLFNGDVTEYIGGCLEATETALIDGWLYFVNKPPPQFSTWPHFKYSCVDMNVSLTLTLKCQRFNPKTGLYSPTMTMRQIQTLYISVVDTGGARPDSIPVSVAIRDRDMALF